MTIPFNAEYWRVCPVIPGPQRSVGVSTLNQYTKETCCLSGRNTVVNALSRVVSTHVQPR